MFRLTYILAILLFGQPICAQIITGVVTNEFKEPLPFANVYVQQLGTGTTTDDLGRYELRMRQEGEYHLAFTSLGYESKLKRIMLEGDTAWINVQLQTSGVELEEITVSASERDPAFGIIRKVIDNKDNQLEAVSSYRVQIYMKAVETSENTSRETAA
ncbi:MAG: carboxypeptidase-like regulatory domain-containing protein, partial [Bacteroidota bacterium]